MESGFKNVDLATRSRDGRNVVLLEPLVYVTTRGQIFRAPTGGTSDGISTPRLIWNLIPTDGKGWFCGILHDAAYREQLEEQGLDGIWRRVSLTRLECDELMREALPKCGVSEFETDVIYRNLRIFGEDAFNKDRGIK